jgi:hypothetical protein
MLRDGCGTGRPCLAPHDKRASFPAICRFVSRQLNGSLMVDIGHDALTTLAFFADRAASGDSPHFAEQS